MTIKLPQLGPGIEFPNFRLPWRDATTASPPGRSKRATAKWATIRTSASPASTTAGSTASSSSTPTGNIIEDWTQWDKMLRRPHAVYISPYDPEKRVWIVDDYRHAIFIFSNDGKRLLQTIGEPNVHAADDKHFYRPTFMAWLPDGSVLRRRRLREHARREVRQERQVSADVGPGWGSRSCAPPEKRPSYFNNVHGIAVDPMTRRVFVNDRATTACRSSTRTASTSTSGASGRRRRTSTCSSSAPIGICGPPTAERRRC